MMLKLNRMWKDESSGSRECPALYQVEGGYVVQGVKLTDEERAQLLDFAANEDAVFVPANVLDRLRTL